MDFVTAKKWLNDLPEPATWDLARMRSVVQDSGLNLDKLNAIQIAGTNGKGSTAAFLEAMLRHAGIKTGLYTSPHLLDVRERIQINGKLISKKKFAELVHWAKPFVHKHNASYFEASTLMAFKHFLDQCVDWAIVEVGLGGRLDATSVLVPKIAIITNIGLEHTVQLGNTIEKIALEKAGIISKNGVVLTAARANALKVIRQKAREKNARVQKVAPLKIVEQNPLKVKFGATIMPLALQGGHQAQNAALAVAAALKLQKQAVIDREDIHYGLQHAHWPGRLQTVGNVTIDGAHNPDGIQSLIHRLKTLKPNKKHHLIFGVLADKNYKKMVRLLDEYPFKSIQLVSPKSGRALPAEKLKNYFHLHHKDTHVVSDVQAALNQLNQKNVVICGSLYVVAETLAVLQKKKKN